MRVRTEGNGSAWATNATTRYLYDGWLVIEERDGSNTPRLAYTRGRDLSGSRSGAGGIGGLLALTRYDTPSPAHAWYHADGSGNVTALVNSGQFLVARYLYDPYGGLLAQSGGWSDLNRLRFSSKEHLTSSGLYAYGRRFHAPELGRWLNRDPLGESGGLNLYAFVGNDPLHWLDPWGLQSPRAIHISIAAWSPNFTVPSILMHLASTTPKEPATF
jgi:RHS repeat-associated protein